jgi:hypothetical protein
MLPVAQRRVPETEKVMSVARRMISVAQGMPQTESVKPVIARRMTSTY